MPDGDDVDVVLPNSIGDFGTVEVFLAAELT